MAFVCAAWMVIFEFKKFLSSLHLWVLSHFPLLFMSYVHIEGNVKFKCGGEGTIGFSWLVLKMLKSNKILKEKKFWEWLELQFEFEKKNCVWSKFNSIFLECMWYASDLAKVIDFSMSKAPVRNLSLNIYSFKREYIYCYFISRTCLESLSKLEKSSLHAQKWSWHSIHSHFSKMTNLIAFILCFTPLSLNHLNS